MINPDHKFKRAWDVYVLLLTVFTAVDAPLHAVLHFELRGSLLFMDVLVPLSFAIDVALNFMTGYREEGRLVTGRRIIARRYVRSWFVPDLLASLPFTALIAFSAVPPAGTLGQILLNLQLLRLLRLVHLAKFMARLARKNVLNPAILRLLFFAFWTGLLAHWVACVWIAIGMGNAGEIEPGRMYLRSLYFAVVTLTTVGYGDITPTTTAQTGFAIVVVICGAGLYGYIIGNVAHLLGNIDRAKSHHKEQMDRVNAFMTYHVLPVNLQKRIHDYYEYIWESRRGYNEAEVVSDLPESLKTEVVLFLNRDIIEKVPIFQDAGPEIVRRIALALKPVVVTPGDFVFQRGDHGHEMFFVSRGHVEVVGQDGETVYATLSEGQFFGEMALLSNLPRNASIRALDFCDLYQLDKSTFESVIKDFPDFAARVHQLAEKRRESRPSLLG